MDTSRASLRWDQFVSLSTRVGTSMRAGTLRSAFPYSPAPSMGAGWGGGDTSLRSANSVVAQSRSCRTSAPHPHPPPLKGGGIERVRLPTLQGGEGEEGAGS